jgi:hypothetical protein
MELDRRQVIGGALALLAGGVIAPKAAASAVMTPTHRTRRENHLDARFPGDPGAGNLYYGACVMGSLSLPNLEQQLGSIITVRRSYYSPTGTAGLIQRCREDHAAGRFPMVSTKVPGTWADVAAGRQDAWLLTLLRGLGALTKPVQLALHHEPEEQAGPPGMAPSDFVAMQTHAIALAKTNAPNTTIVPILMQWTFDPRSGRKANDWVVPTSEVFGFDCYNDWSPGAGAPPWKTFAEKASLALPFAGSRPIAIPEYGCHTDPSQPGRAAQWMRDAFAFASAHNIVSMAYYDSNLHSRWGSWVLDAERIGAMKDCIHRSNVARLPK